MGKKRTLAIILLLCVLGGLIACGRKEKEDEYTYTIKLNDNASGSKQFSSCGYLWVYSVTDQMFTKYGNGEMPSSWTVGDTYIFFTTEQKNGGMDSSYKLWRCNKATNECEFLGDMSGNAGQMYLPYVGKKIERLLKLREEMHFEVYWDGACGADKIATFAPMGVKGFVLGTTVLFGKGRPYADILKEIRQL